MFAVHRQVADRLWTEARVFEYAGGERWIGVCWAMTGSDGHDVCNGKLCRNPSPGRSVSQDGPQWSRLQQLDLTPDVRYRRVWSMAVYGGRLYCGTLPSGRVFSMEAGKCVTHDYELSPGWHHIAARRAATSLALFVDGQPVASAEDVGLRTMDIENEAPLLIGSGPVDDFNGRLRDVRLYGRALSDEQIKRLASM